MKTLLLTIFVLFFVEFFFGVFNSFWSFAFLSVLFFVCFNFLEAVLPSNVSKIVDLKCKGFAMAVFSTAQSLGVFAGNYFCAKLFGLGFGVLIFYFCAFLCLVWIFIFSLNFKKKLATIQLN